MNRRHFIQSSFITAAAVAATGVPEIFAGDVGDAWKLNPEPNIIPAPKDPALWPEFRQQLAEWRVKKRAELNYSDALYRRPEFAWVPGSYALPGVGYRRWEPHRWEQRGGYYHFRRGGWRR